MPIKNDENKLRAYPIRGYDIPYWGATSILNFVFGFPVELNRWSVKVAVQAVLDLDKAHKEKGGRKPSQKLKFDVAQAARLDYLHRAGEKGTAVHSYVEHKLSHGKHPENFEADYEPYYQAFLKFEERCKPVPLKQETVVFSDEYHFAGRFDFYGEIELNGVKEKVLIDFKTSRFLKPEYGLQLAAYRHCIEEMLGLDVEKMYVLHLKDNGDFNLVRYADTFEDFLNVLNVFNWKAQREQPSYFWASDEAALAAEIKALEETTPTPESPTEVELDPKSIKPYTA